MGGKAPAQKRLRKNASERASSANSGTAKGRGPARRLDLLMRAPVDILYEIVSHLHPLDLINVARTSKPLRTLLMTRKSRSVWRSCLGNVRGLPPCPDEMNEPAYAALLFERICTLCGSNRPIWLDYAIRLRLCKSCQKIYIQTGEEMLAEDGIEEMAQRLIMAMVPCEAGKDIEYAEHLEQALSHRPDHLYFLPQLRLAWARPVRPKGEDEHISKYVDFVAAGAVRIHKHATALLRWERDFAVWQQQDQDNLKAVRKASIVAKLADLGYDERDFPVNDQWSKMVDQPKELTESTWKHLRPKLKALIQEEKERRVRAAFDDRVTHRMGQIAGFFDKFFVDIPDEQRCLLPNEFDACHLPSLLALAQQNDAQGDVAEADFLALTTQVQQEVDAYKTRAKEIAVMMIADRTWCKAERHAWNSTLTKLPPEQVLTRHYALFRCSETPECQTGPLAFEALHAHWRAAHPQTAWGSSAFDTVWNTTSSSKLRNRIGVCGDFKVGGEILKAVGLRLGTRMKKLDELVRSGRLYCSCGDPALPPPEELDWAKLLMHVKTDIHAYIKRKRARTKNANPKLILKANHVLTGPNPCIKLLAEGADTGPARSRAIVVDDKTRGKVDERLTKRPDADYYPVCRICKGLTAKEYMKYGCREMQLPDTPEGIVYHLRAWHDKEFEKRDILWDYGSVRHTDGFDEIYLPEPND